MCVCVRACARARVCVYIYIYTHVSQPIVSGTVAPVVLNFCGWINIWTFLGSVCLEVFKCSVTGGCPSVECVFP
jgi:hypothetical protein